MVLDDILRAHSLIASGATRVAFLSLTKYIRGCPHEISKEFLVASYTIILFPRRLPKTVAEKRIHYHC